MPLLASALLATDLVFLTGHFGVIAGLWDNGWRWYLHSDGGNPELFQYLKAFWLALITLGAAAVRGRRWMVGWTLLFLVVLADDKFMLHERVGARLVNRSDGRLFGMRMVDFGEMAAMAMLGAVSLGSALLATWLGGPAVRRFAWAMAGPLAMLVFCGGVVDLIHEHVWVHARPTLHTGFVLIEDFGEHLAMTWAVVAAVAWRLRDADAD